MIVDSGDRREFDTGAVRDMPAGKGRCDLMPLGVVCELFGANPVLKMIDNYMCDGDPEHLYLALDAFCGAAFGGVYETMVLETAVHFEDGALKYGEGNWQKGIPTKSYIDSAVRHFMKFRRGDSDERHDRAFVWNILCCVWTCKHKPELNSYAKEEER